MDKIQLYICELMETKGIRKKPDNIVNKVKKRFPKDKLYHNLLGIIIEENLCELCRKGYFEKTRKIVEDEYGLKILYVRWIMDSIGYMINKTNIANKTEPKDKRRQVVIIDTTDLNKPYQTNGNVGYVRFVEAMGFGNCLWKSSAISNNMRLYKATVNEIIDSFNINEQKIIRAYFGIDEEKLPIELIAEKMKIDDKKLTTLLCGIKTSMVSFRKTKIMGELLYSEKDRRNKPIFVFCMLSSVVKYVKEENLLKSKDLINNYYKMGRNSTTNSIRELARIVSKNDRNNKNHISYFEENEWNDDTFMFDEY